MMKTKTPYLVLMLVLLSSVNMNAGERISLRDVPFYSCVRTWGADAQTVGPLDFTTDPNTTNTDNTCLWIVGTAAEVVYGDIGVNNFADLSAYAKLIVTIAEGSNVAPRILLNRDVQGGQWDGNEAQSHMIDNSMGGWCSKYFSQEGRVWTVDIEQIKKDKGFVHLHAIKGFNWGHPTIETMEVELPEAEPDGDPHQLVINEICASNIDGTMSLAYNFDSWIELYNPTDKAASLAGLYLADGTEEWQMPAGVGYVPALGYKVVWLGSGDIDERQAPFKLSCDGGIIVLNDGSGEQITTESYPAALSRTSWARRGDGVAAWGWTSTPTPGRSNATAVFAASRLDAPWVTPSSCTFQEAFTVEVDIPDGCTLRYTTDGSLPTEQSDTSATGVFSVAETTNYRFRLFRDGYLPSVPVTRSYIQGNTTLPVVSVVGDERYFSDPQIGITVRGTNGVAGGGHPEPCNWYRDWERPVNFSYIKDGAMVFNQDVEIAVSGAATRNDEPKSFKLKSGKEFDGQNTLPYPFFDQKPYIRNKTVVLRNGGNDNVDGSGGRQYAKARFRDAAIQTVLLRAGIDLDVQAYQPVVRYINGRRDGVINLREPNNKKYAAANYGYDDDALDFFELNIYQNLTMTEGTDETLNRIFDLGRQAAGQTAYDELRQLLDIDAYCNYMAMELYLCSKDWPHNNMKGFRPPQGRYRIVTFDLDLILRVDNPFTTFANEQWYRFQNVDGTNQDHTEEIRFVTLFLNMLQNDRFRRQFIDTYCMMAGSIFDFERVKTILNELADRVRPEMQVDGMSPDGSLNFLLDKLGDNHAERMIDCLRTFEPIGLADASMFSVQLSVDAPGARLFVNDIEVPYAQFKGKLFAPASVRAKAPGGYRFVGWRLSGSGNILSPDTLMQLPAESDRHYEAHFVELRPNQRVEKVVVNEVSASNSMAVNDLFKRADWVELYNISSQPIDLTGYYLSDDPANPHKHQFAGGIIPAHGCVIVWCDKQDPQGQLHASFKLAAEGGIVSVTAPDDSWTSSLTYTQHDGDESVGRFPDGAATVYHFSHPTIDAPNRLSSYAIIVDQPETLGIVDVVQQPQPEMPAYYNLHGMRVGSSARGVLIRDGWKYIK